MSQADKATPFGTRTTRKPTTMAVTPVARRSARGVRSTVVTTAASNASR